MPYVMDDSGEDACGETIIEAHGVAHRITFEVDHIKQEPKITHTTKPSKVVKGTRITVMLPRINYGPYVYGVTIVERRFLALAESYAWLNPHLSLKVKWHGKVRINVKASNPNWKKWLPSGQRQPTGTMSPACAAICRRTSLSRQHHRPGIYFRTSRHDRDCEAKNRTC